MKIGLLIITLVSFIITFFTLYSGKELNDKSNMIGLVFAYIAFISTFITLIIFFEGLGMFVGIIGITGIGIYTSKNQTK